MFKKDNFVKPMLTGYKEIRSEALAAPEKRAHQGGWLAFVNAVLATATAVYLASGAPFEPTPPAAVAPATASATTQAAPAW